MNISFINSFQSEWLKKKRSLASWMVLVGAFFIPSVILTARMGRSQRLPALYAADDFWNALWKQSWESMATFFLPMGIILATALVTQLEYKNNAWKQLHTTPQRFSTIFFAKLTVTLIMLAGLFILFNFGIYLSAMIPLLLFKTISYPAASIPFSFFLNENIKLFIDCLPILALQYLISLQFKNFLVPVGVGFLIWILSIGMLSWEYSHFLPYSHSALDHFISSGQLTGRQFPISLQWIAAGYFTVFTIAGYILYITKKEKG